MLPDETPPLATGPSHCRQCGGAVQSAASWCPHCGAPRPGEAIFTGLGFEWKTRRTWMGYPLIHIAFGLDADGRGRTARGVVAIGQRAIGAVAVGVMAGGLLAVGFVAIGVGAAGVVALACGAAVGVNAVAPVAVGLTAFGLIAKGLSTFHWR